MGSQHAPAMLRARAVSTGGWEFRASGQIAPEITIAREREKGPRLRLGAIKVDQPSDTRLVIRIDPDDIKRPPSYRWRAEATTFGSDCKSSTGCPDYAPDRPATAETKLGKPRARAA